MKQSGEKPWSLPQYLYDNYSDITIEFLEFALAQAEKILNETVRSGEGITEKAYKVLTIGVSVLTGSIIYLVQNVYPVQKAGWESPISVAALLAVPMCLTSIWLLIRPLKSYETFVAGSPPKLVLVEKLIKGFPGKQQIKNALLNECHNYQERIDQSDAQNRTRGQAVDQAMYWLLALPLTLIFSTGLYIFINLALNN
jgi:hypothetical protein